MKISEANSDMVKCPYWLNLVECALRMMAMYLIENVYNFIAVWCYCFRLTWVTTSMLVVS